MTQPVLSGPRPMPYVLMYHSIAATAHDPHAVSVRPARFEAQLRWLRRHGYRGVSMRELLDAWARKRARGLIGLTFDDGYADFVETVLPTLAREGHTATVFVLAGRLGGHNGWETEGPRKSLMAVEHVRIAARSGMEIGSHGMYHLHLPQLDTSALRAEIEESRALLREVSGQSIDGFCYPYGHLSAGVLDAVRDGGYDYGCAIWRSPLTGRHAVPRTYIGDRDRTTRLYAKRFRHGLRELTRSRVRRIR